MSKFVSLKKWNEVVTGVTICAAAILSGSSARAVDAYKLNIETGFEIEGSCTNGSINQSSEIDLVVDTATAETNPKVLTNGAARIRVCSPWSSPVNETLPIPLPIALMKQSSKVAVGQMVKFVVSSPKLAAMFTDGAPPDSLQVTKTASNAFELRYIQSSTGDTVIGPIRATLGSVGALARVPGFNAASSLPIQHIEIDVAEKNITLKADIASVKVLAKTPAALVK